MIISGQVSSVPDSAPAAQVETCTLSVGGYGEVLCTIYEDGMFQAKHITVNSDNPGNCQIISNVVVGSLVVPMSTGESYLASTDNYNALTPVYGTASDSIFRIIGDASMSVACFVRGTRIATGLRSAKAVEDITYEDMLLVWDFDNACLTYAKPCWIKKSEATTYYYNCVFSDGTELKVVGSDGKSHRLFNCDKQEFISATDCVGQMVMGLNGPVKMLSCDRVEELVEFYNVVTSKHMNLYANGMLASCRLNNLYPIQNMQYVKDDRAVVRKGAYDLIAQKYYDDLRLGERLPGDVDWINQYVERMDQRRV
jgi:hypothetical protein